MRRAGRGREGREAGSAAVRAHTTPLSISLYLAALCPAATARPPLARRGLSRRGHLLGDQEAAGDGRRHCAERERGGENDPRKNALVGREFFCFFCFFNLVRLSSQATARRRLRFLSRTRRFTHTTHRSHTHIHTHGRNTTQKNTIQNQNNQTKSTTLEKTQIVTFFFLSVCLHHPFPVVTTGTPPGARAARLAGSLPACSG